MPDRVAHGPADLAASHRRSDMDANSDRDLAVAESAGLAYIDAHLADYDQWLAEHGRAARRADADDQQIDDRLDGDDPDDHYFTVIDCGI